MYQKYSKINIIIDDMDFIPDTHLPRVIEDKASNGECITLLVLCKATKLRITNANKFGEDCQSCSYLRMHSLAMGEFPKWLTSRNLRKFK